MFKIILISSFFIHSTVSQTVIKLSAPETGLSVSVIWDECTQSLYYVDFLGTGTQPTLFRYDNNEERTYSAYIDGYGAASFILPISGECNKNNNLFMVGIGHNTRVVEWNGKSPVAHVVSELFGLEENDPLSILSVARQSIKGRFYGGTFHLNFCSANANSSVYTYTKEKGVQRLFGGIQTTTGLAFDDKRGYLYHMETCKGLITGFKSNDNGDICDGFVVYDFKTISPDLLPIGLESDTDGNIYTGIYNDGSIWKINPKEHTAVPVARLTVKGIGGIVFGGRRRDVLFAVAGSAYIDVISGQVVERTNAGTSLFKITGLGARGNRFKRVVV